MLSTQKKYGSFQKEFSCCCCVTYSKTLSSGKNNQWWHYFVVVANAMPFNFLSLSGISDDLPKSREVKGPILITRNPVLVMWDFPIPSPQCQQQSCRLHLLQEGREATGKDGQGKYLQLIFTRNLGRPAPSSARLLSLHQAQSGRKFLKVNAEQSRAQQEKMWRRSKPSSELFHSLSLLIRPCIIPM